MKFGRMHRSPRPDFLADTTPRLFWPALLALAGAAALAAALAAAWATRSELDRLSLPPVPRSRSALALAPAAAAATSPAEVEARRSAIRVVAALDHPWPLFLATVEDATPTGVQWLSLDHAAASGEVRLEGEAGDVGAALGVVDRLAAKDGWRDVALVRWRRPADAASPSTRASSAAASAIGPATVRFAIEARLDAGAVAAPAKPAGS